MTGIGLLCVVAHLPGFVLSLFDCEEALQAEHASNFWNVITNNGPEL